MAKTKEWLRNRAAYRQLPLLILPFPMHMPLGPLLEALDQFNEETRALSVGPIIELVPLPTSSQFLNVIEGVLSGMTRAVINNSDYPDVARMKQVISRHFSERNECFRHNPRRVGKKIWEFDSFQDFDALRGANY